MASFTVTLDCRAGCATLVPYVVRVILLVGFFLMLVSPLRAGDGIDFFEKKIRPVLIKHCYECHSAGSGDVKGEFRLDSREGIRRGGESGPAIVPKRLDGESVDRSDSTRVALKCRRRANCRAKLLTILSSG